MEKFFENLGWKKLAVLMAAVSIVAIIFVLISLSQTPLEKGSPPQNTLDVVVNSNNTRQKLGKNQPELKRWKTYQNSDFKMDYPSTLEVSEGQTDTNDLTLLFSSSNKSQRFEIELLNPSTTSMDKLLSIFSGFGFSQRNINISGVNANYFTGSISLGSQHLQEKAIIFESGGKIYKIQASYDSKTQDSEIEQDYSRMMQSFSLK